MICKHDNKNYKYLTIPIYVQLIKDSEVKMMNQLNLKETQQY